MTDPGAAAQSRPGRRFGTPLTRPDGVP